MAREMKRGPWTRVNLVVGGQHLQGTTCSCSGNKQDPGKAWLLLAAGSKDWPHIVLCLSLQIPFLFWDHFDWLVRCLQ